MPDARHSLGACLATAVAVIFDYNGTLSLDEDLLASLYREAAREVIGLEPSDERYRRYCVGLADSEIAGILAAAVGESTRSDEFLARATERHAPAVALRPRIPDQHVDLVGLLPSFA